jgi:hypothetical protein
MSQSIQQSFICDAQIYQGRVYSEIGVHHVLSRFFDVSKLCVLRVTVVDDTFSLMKIDDVKQQQKIY